MRIGFFGTPELSARVLADLAERHDVLFAVTGADRAAGRGREMLPCPAKRTARELGIPVLQPATLKGPAFLADIEPYDAEAYVVVAYGMLIPRAVFARPPLGTVNLHPSLLPKYRGAAPVQWALINGETETGITVQLINERLDAGDIVVQEALPVDGDATAADLNEIVASRGPELIDRAVSALAGGSARPVPQDESRATYCGKIDRETARVRWDAPAAAVHNLVRGLNPKPVCHAAFRGDNVLIWKTALFREADPPGIEPGVLARYRKKRLLAGTGGGCIEILSVQPANRKVMDAQSFINGYRIAEGDRFE